VTADRRFPSRLPAGALRGGSVGGGRDAPPPDADHREGRAEMVDDRNEVPANEPGWLEAAVEAKRRLRQENSC
jgi:hypothetical protein